MTDAHPRPLSPCCYAASSPGLASLPSRIGPSPHRAAAPSCRAAPSLRRAASSPLAALLLLTLVACAGPQQTPTGGPTGAPPPTPPLPVASAAARSLGPLPPGQTQRPAILIRGGDLWTADSAGRVLAQHDLLIVEGRIAAIGKDLKAPAGAITLDATGQVVTPGLVDLHSHLGVYAAPSSIASADGNEMTQPLTPMVRAIDAFDPEDPAIARALGGGVTTALVLPGSGNVMGGLGVPVKLRGATVADMTIADAPLQMKMAMGENPKRNHGGKGRMPSTRMGHAWLMRERFAAARAQLQRATGGGGAEAGQAGAAAGDRSLDTLVALLRGEVRLHVHCYEVHDIETLLRVTAEYGVPVAAIHHALEAWKVPGLLQARGIGVATFADLWGFKMEAQDASVRGPAILAAAGVAVAIKSDHPVLDARDLMFEAAKSHHHGLPAQAALAAVTRVPAELMGLGARIGSLEVGKQADVAIWPSPPLTSVAVRPSHVLVDGAVWVEPSRNHQQAYAGPARAEGGSPCGCGL